MMKRTAIIAAICALPQGLAIADDERRNPFTHTLKVTGDTLERAPIEEEDLTVTAILASGADSLVSVDGAVIGIGERHYGFTLVSVSEETATFKRENQTITVSLYDGNENDDE